LVVSFMPFLPRLGRDSSMRGERKDGQLFYSEHPTSSTRCD
jgi:hypothetical protein